jgi:hypothetical protein
MRIAGLVVGACIAVLGVREADACGFWSMTDKERGFEIGWLVNAGSITMGGRGTKTEKRIGALYLDLDNKPGLRVAQGKTVVFDIKGDKVRKYGKPIATIDASGAVSFGGRIYTIELTDPRMIEQIMPAWNLTVKRGDKVIIESSLASSLCAGMHRDPPMTDAESREEVRRRVIFYLAWRETGGM